MQPPVRSEERWFGVGARQLLLVAAVCTLALALNHFLYHWILFTDATLRRFLY